MSDRSPVVNNLLGHGWALVYVDAETLTLEELWAVTNWEGTFREAFSLPKEEKEAAGAYRTECGVSVGYRVDSEREFFETRIRSDHSVDPHFAQVERYDYTVIHLYAALNKVAASALKEIASYMQIDSNVFLDLTDIATNGVLPNTTKSKETGEVITATNLSSTLLRICKYQDSSSPMLPQAQIEVIANPMLSTEPTVFTASQQGMRPATDTVANAATHHTTPAATAAGSVWFGAHTDSSLLTLSLCSTTPGLDIVDQKENRWVAPELLVLEQKGKQQQLRRAQQQQEQCNNGRDKPLTGENASEKITMIQEGNSVVVDSQSSASGGAQKIPVIIFVGEFLQVLSKHRFKAAVHRVRDVSANYTRKVLNDDDGTAVKPSEDEAVTGGDFAEEQPQHQQQEQQQKSPSRVSCPYLIRGRHGAIFDIHNPEKYAHPGGAEAIADENMPNLDGTSVKMMHKLLDLKRQRCFRENGSAEGASWVLSAYPVPPLPVEIEAGHEEFNC